MAQETGSNTLKVELAAAKATGNNTPESIILERETGRASTMTTLLPSPPLKTTGAVGRSLEETRISTAMGSKAGSSSMEIGRSKLEARVRDKDKDKVQRVIPQLAVL